MTDNALKKPPGEQPQRPEIMVAVGQGEESEVAPGISFERLAGPHNGAIGLTTGIATAAPGSSADFSLVDDVALCLLAAELTVTVDDRAHQLGKLDCLYAPAGSAL